MCCSPVGQQVQEVGHSTGGKNDFMVYAGLTKALRTEGVLLCDRTTWCSPVKGLSDPSVTINHNDP